MKVLGIILVVAGIVMLVFGGFKFTQEKKVVDLGPVEINKKEEKRVNWPPYAGAIALLGGIGLIVMDRKK